MRSEMREPTYLVLAALAGGRLHGYAIINEAAAIAKGGPRLRVGSLYATLDRLAEQRLVEQDGDEIIDGRHRRYYRLTPEGTSLLAAEARSRVETGNRVLGRLGLAGGFA